MSSLIRPRTVAEIAKTLIHDTFFRPIPEGVKWEWQTISLWKNTPFIDYHVDKTGYSEHANWKVPEELKQWGYGRLENGEAENSRWTKLFIGGVHMGWVWIEKCPFLGGIYLLHVCVNPSFKGRWSRGLIGVFKEAAKQVGCKRLWAVPPRPLKDYMLRLERFGWHQPSPGVFMLNVS